MAQAQTAEKAKHTKAPKVGDNITVMERDFPILELYSATWDGKTQVCPVFGVHSSYSAVNPAKPNSARGVSKATMNFYLVWKKDDGETAVLEQASNPGVSRQRRGKGFAKEVKPVTAEQIAKSDVFKDLAWDERLRFSPSDEKPATESQDEGENGVYSVSFGAGNHAMIDEWQLHNPGLPFDHWAAQFILTELSKQHAEREKKNALLNTFAKLPEGLVNRLSQLDPKALESLLSKAEQDE